MKGLCVTVLRVLYQEDHKKCNDRRSGIDYKLPCVGIVEYRSGYRPHHQGQNGKQEHERVPYGLCSPAGKPAEPKVDGVRLGYLLARFAERSLGGDPTFDGRFR